MNERCTAVRPLIHDYLEGELAAARSDLVRDHLERCRPCRGHAEAWIEDLHLLLAVEEPAAATHWPALRRKLRWRGPRSASRVSPWLQLLCALAALAIVFGSVGFLIWLEAHERGEGEALVFDPLSGELALSFDRGGRMKFGPLDLAAQTGAPSLCCSRLGTSDLWDLRVMWGSVAVSRGTEQLYVAKDEERWLLPRDEHPSLELEFRARRGNDILGPWPKVRVWTGALDTRSPEAIADEQGLCRVELPLRLEPAATVWVQADGASEAQALPPLEELLAQRGRLVHVLDLDAVRHVRRVAILDREHRAVVDVRIVVRREELNAVAKSSAHCVEPGFAEVPLWFEGPYRYGVFDEQGAALLEAVASELPESLVLPAR